MKRLLLGYAFISFILSCKSFNFSTGEEKGFMWDLVKFDFNIGIERSYGGISVSTILGEQPLYVSIAVISGRIKNVSKIIWSILNGIVIPTHIFLFISRDPFMMDEGITEAEIPLELQYLAASTDIFSIVYTDNIGPHRKLLPILQHYWKEDCVIVTFDDDRLVAKDALFRLINHYVDSNRESIVGLRTRRIGLCASNNIHSGKNHGNLINKNIDNSDNNDIKNVENEISAVKNTKQRRLSSKLNLKSRKYLKIILDESKFRLANYDFCFWPRIQNSKKEFLVLPTGNGGILYRPNFFHKIVFDPILRGLTLYNDDLTFRLSTLANKVYVINGCCEKLEFCSNKTVGRNNMKIKPPQDAFTKLRNQYLLSENYTQSSNEQTKNMNESSLYSRNLYWNTDMWLSGIAYLKKMKIIDISEFYDSKFLLHDRPECFHRQKVIDRRQCGIFSSCSFPA